MFNRYFLPLYISKTSSFLLFFLSFLIIFNFSFGYILYAGSGNGEGSIDISEESSGNMEGGGDETDNYKNSFWYGKVALLMVR